MARRRKMTDDYPAEFKEIIKEAARTGTHRIEVRGTEKEKMNQKIALRAHLYRFITAMKEEAREWERARDAYYASMGKGRAPLPAPRETWVTEYAGFVRQLGVVFEGDAVKLQAKNQGTLARLLAASLPGGMEGREEDWMKDAEELREKMKDRHALGDVPEGEAEKEPEALDYGKVKIEENE